MRRQAPPKPRTTLKPTYLGGGQPHPRPHRWRLARLLCAATGCHTCQRQEAP